MISSLRFNRAPPPWGPVLPGHPCAFPAIVEAPCGPWRAKRAVPKPC